MKNKKENHNLLDNNDIPTTYIYKNKNKSYSILKQI